jgi:hypothetical protein
VLDRATDVRCREAPEPEPERCALTEVHAFDGRLELGHLGQLDPANFDGPTRARDDRLGNDVKTSR